MQMCKDNCLAGRINSVQSFGAADGPGVRFVVFMQGCPLRCLCCHNPETWKADGGYEITVNELCEKINRCKSYFGSKGGLTVSGGEPLMQPEFLIALFERIKSFDINTAIDTSGCILNERIKKLLELTDLVILDYKYTDADAYRKYTGCEKTTVDTFLDYLNDKKITTWIRHVVIPGYNNSEESVKKIALLPQMYSCIKKTELLPFRKFCLEKYNEMKIPFLLADVVEPSDREMDLLRRLLKI